MESKSSLTSLAVSTVPVVSIIILEFFPSIIMALANAKPTATCTPSVTSMISFLNSKL